MYKENNKYIGNVGINSIQWINRSAEFGIMIGDTDEWGKGYGREAIILTLKYSFEELNLNRISLTVREDNKNAISLYRKVGFIQEGILRKSIFKNNMYVNLIAMSILKDEFNG